jgi:spermidine/putrescine transport system ATP-binding protein
MAGRDLRLESVSKTFGSFTAVDGVDLHVPSGSFFALLGPSGCGKTTTLRMVAGLERPTAGRILLGDEDVTETRPYKRPVNTVFQSYALFPHLDVYENVAFGLRRRRAAEVRRQVGEALELVELGHLAKRRPTQLSSSSGWRWPGPWSTGRTCCCWTSRSARWTSSCAGRCSWSSSGSRTRWASRSCTSPTTRRRP